MRMRPRTFTPEQMKNVRSESKKQTVDNVVPKSTDPENFPVFEIPVNAKVLIYVPNHVEVDEETGMEDLVMDTPLIHTIKDGKRYLKIRCIRGMSEATGYSGNCPLCDATGEPWDLANELIKDQCSKRGLNPTDSESENVKAIKRECYSNRVVKDPDQYYTFPIVVIETDPNDFKKIISDENGIPKHRTYWYTVSRSAYEKKWLKALEGMEDEPSHPGGYFFILNYTYESKSGDYNKRDSAREMVVTPKTWKSGARFAEIFDSETEGWTAEKAIETVIDNQYFDEEDIQMETDRVMASTREKLAIYQELASAGAIGANPGFTLSKQPTPGIPGSADDDLDAGLPLTGQVDED